MSIGSNDRFIQRESVRLRKQLDGYGLFHTENARFYTMNSICHLLWLKCNGKNTYKEIAKEIHESCEDPPKLKSIEDDVKKILEKFLNHDLIMVK